MENKNETLEITNNELEYGNLIDLRSSPQVCPLFYPKELDRGSA